MAKQSKSNRQRRLPHPPSPSDRARFRLLCVEFAARRGTAEAVLAFGISGATVSRWRKGFRPDDLRSLEPRSRRPKRTRKRQWTAQEEQAVLALRQQYPRIGKDPLWVLLREPHAVRVRRTRSQRPYATRVPKDKRVPTEPGALVQLDTMHLRPLPGLARFQFTAIDVVSRCAVVGVRATASSGTARVFLEELLARMPFPVGAIQVDGGSEFMAGFETACQERGIALYVLPPRSPTLNGRVERLNGTSRREFWECYDGDLDLPTLQTALRAWEVTYNTIRPHQALGHQTPAAFLHSRSVSNVLN